jgi:hypothetical protein
MGVTGRAFHRFQSLISKILENIDDEIVHDRFTLYGEQGLTRFTTMIPVSLAA